LDAKQHDDLEQLLGQHHEAIETIGSRQQSTKWWMVNMDITIMAIWEFAHPEQKFHVEHRTNYLRHLRTTKAATFCKRTQSSADMVVPTNHLSPGANTQGHHAATFRHPFTHRHNTTLLEVHWIVLKVHSILHVLDEYRIRLHLRHTSRVWRAKVVEFKISLDGIWQLAFL